MPHPSARESSVHLHLQRSWPTLEKALVQVVQEVDKPALHLLRSLHEAGIPRPILFALTNLGVSSSDGEDLVREEHIEAVALYLASIKHTRSSKLALLRVLFTLRSREAQHWSEDVVRDCLDMILLRDFVWRNKEQQHYEADLVFLWELRARTRHVLETKRYPRTITSSDRVSVSRAIKGGDAAVEAISSTAKLVSLGLSLSVPVIHEGLDMAGSKLKSVLTPEEAPLLTPRTGEMTLACTHAAKQATDKVRETARTALYGIRDASTEGISRAAKKFEEEKLGERLVPNKESRELLATAGKVGVASLGAVAIVGEAMFESTRSVAKKASNVTADVVSYKYGEEAGQVVKDVGDTTGNILRTATYVACLERRILTKVVAKNTAKLKERERLGYDGLVDPELLLDHLKLEAYQVVKKLQVANLQMGAGPEGRTISVPRAHARPLHSHTHDSSQKQNAIRSRMFLPGDKTRQKNQSSMERSIVCLGNTQEPALALSFDDID